MSFTSVNGPESMAAPHLESPGSTPKQTYKSYKKKYRKMRHLFEEKMRCSNMLFGDEQKAMKLARKLQEQNDQLLDLLLDVNESARIPPQLRYDLRSPTPPESAVPALEPDVTPPKPYDIKSAHAALEEAKMELALGQITPGSYNNLEAALTEALNKPKTFAQLNRTPHSVLETVLSSEEEVLPSDIGETAPACYFSPSHEEEYLATLDASVEASILGVQPPPSSHPIRSNERHEKEREAQLRNPVSVYNWLRKHQPQVFLQDHESGSSTTHEKPPSNKSLPTIAGSSTNNNNNRVPTNKRASVAPKQEQQQQQELTDDEGFLIGGNLENPSRSKRKREDEPYRPKGGSSRPSKKKKTSGGQAEKRRSGEEEGG